MLVSSQSLLRPRHTMPTMGMKNAVAAETADARVLTARNQWASDQQQ